MTRRLAFVWFPAFYLFPIGIAAAVCSVWAGAISKNAPILPIVACSIGGLAIVAWFYTRVAACRFVVQGGVIVVRAITKSGGTVEESIRCANLGRIRHAYVYEAGATDWRDHSKAGRVLVATVLVEHGERIASIPTYGFAARAEVIARRLRRLRRPEHSTSAPTTREVDAHRARFAAPMDLSRFAGPAASRVLILRKDGMLVGGTRRSATLVPWERVACAHVLDQQLGFEDVLQIELVDGDVIDVSPRSGMGRDELASLLAPRWVSQAGRRHSASRDDDGLERDTMPESAPAPRKTKSKSKKNAKPD